MPSVIFYDGHCTACHRAVRFVLARDARALVRFAPLGGDTFQARVPSAIRSRLPDSLVLLTKDGRVLVKSAATISILFVARVRHRLFGRTSDTCPVASPELRARFDS